MAMAHIRAVKAAGLVIALVLAGVTVAKRGDPDEVQFVLLPDAIPAISDPGFDETGRAGDRVIGVAVGGEAKAYPIPILNFHEVVNDRIGGRDVVVTYCPLCGTGIVYDRVIDGETMEFKVSGRLYKNNLVLQDERTGSLWSQVEGRAIKGAYEGTELEVVGSSVTRLSTWRNQHPDTTVMAPPGDRDYSSDPYAGYDRSDDILYPTGGVRGPLEPKAMIYGVAQDGDAVAYPFSTLAEERVVEDVVGGREIVVTYFADAVQAFYTDGRDLRHASGVTMVDANGTEWNMVTGEGANGSLATAPGVPGFWFAWLDFHPDTELYGAQVGPATDPGFQFPWLHPVSLVAVGVLAWTAFVLGRWAWRRLRGRGRVGDRWVDPRHGWINGILVGIVAAAVLYDASLSIRSIYAIGQSALGFALVGWAGLLVAEWYLHRGRVLKSTGLDGDGIWWDLEATMGNAVGSIRCREADRWHPADLVVELVGRPEEVWVSRWGTVSVPEDADQLKTLVDDALAPWADVEGNK